MSKRQPIGAMKTRSARLRATCRVCGSLSARAGYCAAHDPATARRKRLNADRHEQYLAKVRGS